jgi:hypothetical protein
MIICQNNDRDLGFAKMFGGLGETEGPTRRSAWQRESGSSPNGCDPRHPAPDRTRRPEGSKSLDAEGTKEDQITNRLQRYGKGGKVGTGNRDVVFITLVAPILRLSKPCQNRHHDFVRPNAIAMPNHKDLTE